MYGSIIKQIIFINRTQMARGVWTWKCVASDLFPFDSWNQWSGESEDKGSFPCPHGTCRHQTMLKDTKTVNHICTGQSLGKLCKHVVVLIHRLIDVFILHLTVFKLLEGEYLQKDENWWKRQKCNLGRYGMKMSFLALSLLTHLFKKNATVFICRLYNLRESESCSSDCDQMLGHRGRSFG